jgi:poly(ADP-ribose) glycohydrolase ARH3
MDRFEHSCFFAELVAACESGEYRAKIEAAALIRSPADLAGLGNRIEALHSVPTAVASFGLTPESFEDTISNVIFLGGDTDTLAAMAGSLSGAYLGVGRLPSRLVGLLESSPKGRVYLHKLAGQLLTVYQRRSEDARSNST